MSPRVWIDDAEIPNVFACDASLRQGDFALVSLMLLGVRVEIDNLTAEVGDMEGNQDG